MLLAVLLAANKTATGHDISGQQLDSVWILQHRSYGNISTIYLSKLRWNGFILLNAGNQEVTIPTEPFKISGSKRFVNVDELKGERRVE